MDTPKGQSREIGAEALLSTRPTPERAPAVPAAHPANSVPPPTPHHRPPRQLRTTAHRNDPVATS
ncbi:hypothetical protein AB0F07_12025 [Streptomyces fructofermentans]|uniref:hypothetical protein n=1 Tax=Streptomyces fructofermentans TaxID=152141 RepID=UPI0033D07335